MNETPIRVLLADDHEMTREGLRRILETADIEVVGQAGDGETAVDLAMRLLPDVAVLDIRMPRLDGIAATARIGTMAAAQRPRVLILTTFDLDEYVYKSLRAGASGFMLKNAPPEHVIDAVKAIARGDALLAPEVTRRLIDKFATYAGRTAPADPALAALTAREREVLEHVAEGLTNAEIARRLGVGDETVKTHVSKVLRKIGARDRVQAVILAYEWGIARR